MIQFTSQQADKLSSFRSQAKFRNRHDPVPDEKGKPKISEDGGHETESYVECVLVDQLTGRQWAKGSGSEESAALDDALTNADPSQRPKSQAEIVEENQQLRQKLAAYEQGQSEPASNRDGTTGNESQGGGEASEEPDYDALSANELADAIKAHGGTVPEGDKRTVEWREMAVAELKRLHQQGE